MEPDSVTLEDLILYIAMETNEQGHVLTRTKLVKMLYFLDEHSWREIGRTVTGVDWYWHYFGPYSSTIVEASESLARSGLLEIEETTNFYGKKEYRITSTTRPLGRIPKRFEVVLHHLIGEYGPLSPSELGDRSYDTEPMRRLVAYGQRGDAIEFRARRPSLSAARRAIARYAPLVRSIQGKDEGDVAAGLREEIADLQPARAYSTARLFGDA
jgi:hypothetical protein